MPQSPQLVEFAIALPIALLAAHFIARLIRRLFGERLRLGLSNMTIVSLLGVSGGILIAGWFFDDLRLWMPTTVLLAFGTSLGLSFLVAGLVTVLDRDRRAIDIAALLGQGESDHVELKETARWNVREDRKDARMELAIAKTVAAFLNSGGGILIIGADDTGTGTGLERDLATLRTPDHDRFELWMRDLFSTLLGRNAAALPRLQFGAGGQWRHRLRGHLPSIAQARLPLPVEGRQLDRPLGARGQLDALPGSGRRGRVRAAPLAPEHGRLRARSSLAADLNGAPTSGDSRGGPAPALAPAPALDPAPALALPLPRPCCLGGFTLLSWPRISPSGYRVVCTLT